MSPDDELRTLFFLSSACIQSWWLGSKTVFSDNFLPPVFHGSGALSKKNITFHQHDQLKWVACGRLSRFVLFCKVIVWALFWADTSSRQSDGLGQRYVFECSCRERKEASQGCVQTACGSDSNQISSQVGSMDFT